MNLKQSTAYNLPILMVDSTDHITGKTGLTLTITASKNGAAFGSITPTVTELATGWYNLALTTAHTDTLGLLALHITATGADPMDTAVQIFATTTDDLVRSTTPANTLDVSSTGEAGLDFANIKAATGSTTLTNITVPTVTSVTNDVGITQAGADKVWGSTTRTLSAFGFTVTISSNADISAIKAKTDNLPSNPAAQTNLDVAISTRLATSGYTAPPSASDVATAVWGATTRTLSSFGSLVSDIWSAATRTLSAFGFTVDTNPDTDIAAIKAKTDNLPASPAAVGSAMTLTAAYDKAKDDVLTPLAVVDGVVDAIKLTVDTNLDMAISDIDLNPTLNATVALSRAEAAGVATGKMVLTPFYSFTQTIQSTSMLDLTTATKLWVALKESDVADANGLIFLEETAGLTIVNRISYATPGHGTITLAGVPGDWSITITYDKAATSLLESFDGKDIPKSVKALVDGQAVSLWDGECRISRGIVRAIA